jgi:hypothetical protein
MENQMHLVMYFAAVTCVGLALLFFKLHSRVSSLPVTAEWIEELSVERYRPMLHLLDGEDIELLRSQPGFTPAMEVKLRVQRCQVFRVHLRSLTADFRRVSTALKIVMSQSGMVRHDLVRHDLVHPDLDRHELASVLVHQQMLFYCLLAVVHCRLSLYRRWGIGNVDAAGLVKIFDGMRLKLQSMVPMLQPMSA